LLGRIAGGDPLARLLPAVKAVVPGWSQPIGQNRESLPARFTESAPHPDAFVLVIVALASVPSMANDRNRRDKLDNAAAGTPAASPRFDVVFCFWQCDKKNHGWREGRH
jgi:hypothetical protein